MLKLKIYKLLKTSSEIPQMDYKWWAAEGVLGQVNVGSRFNLKLYLRYLIELIELWWIDFSLDGQLYTLEKLSSLEL